MVTQANDRRRIDTSIVSPGRTCQYRTYVSHSTSSTLPVFVSAATTTTTDYDVVVEVDYIYYDTYLGVYKYYTNSSTYELVREVGQYFSGNITTTMDSNTEIYVQMHPFHPISCAGFFVNVQRHEVQAYEAQNTTLGQTEGASSSKEESETIFLVILVLAVALGVVVLGTVGAVMIYRKYWKPKNKKEVSPRPNNTIEVLSGVANKQIEDIPPLYIVNNSSTNPTPGGVPYVDTNASVQPQLVLNNPIDGRRVHPLPNDVITHAPVVGQPISVNQQV